jgi:hypothetical protein
MVGKGLNRHKRSQQWNRQRCQQSAGCEKSRVRASGADSQPHPFGAPWAIAFIGGFVPVDVHPRVYIAADEMDSNEPAGGRCACAATPVIVEWGVREIELFAGHGGVLRELSLLVQSNFSAHQAVSDKKKAIRRIRANLDGRQCVG